MPRTVGIRAEVVQQRFETEGDLRSSGQGPGGNAYGRGSRIVAWGVLRSSGG